MSPTARPMRRQRAADLITRRRSRLELLRIELPDGASTTAHVASYDLRAFRPRVVLLREATPLVRWCRERGVRDAVVGGFFLRSVHAALGELRVGGVRQPSVPFDSPWGATRACVAVGSEGLQVAPRDRLPRWPDGDLLQAGPLLVSAGAVVLRPAEDPEGFSAGARQFDSDITDGRYPRAALGRDGHRLVVLACDGRTRRDAGMTLMELAGAMAGLGCREAINLDGGGSTSLVYAGRLRNRPREEHGIDLLEGRPILTAIAIESR